MQIAGLKNAPAPFFIKPIIRGIAGKIDSSFVDPELKLHFDFLEDYLIKSPSNGEFFCGTELSGADIMLHFALEGAAQRVPINETSYPKLYAYMKKLQQRPAYARAGQAVEKATGEKFVPFSEVKFM
jgi:glutathione S-transferase